jgi:hypothetical protein
VSTGIRHFIFDGDGTLKRLSQRVHDGVYFRNDRLPQYAGAKVRIATVFILITDGVLDRVRHVDAEIWHFDETGALPPETYGPGHPIHRMHWDDTEVRTVSEQAVVDVAGEIARRRWDRENRWTPTDADVTRMINVIWPKLAGRPVPTAPQVTGTEKRRIPMTQPAKRAIDTLWKPVFDITERIGPLNEKDLKAFIAGAKEKAEPTEPVGSAIWGGIAAAAEKQLEIVKARASSKGMSQRGAARIENAIYAGGTERLGGRSCPRSRPMPMSLAEIWPRRRPTWRPCP